MASRRPWSSFPGVWAVTGTGTEGGPLASHGQTTVPPWVEAAVTGGAVGVTAILLPSAGRGHGPPSCPVRARATSGSWHRPRSWWSPGVTGRPRLSWWSPHLSWYHPTVLVWGGGAEQGQQGRGVPGRAGRKPPAPLRASTSPSEKRGQTQMQLNSWCAGPGGLVEAARLAAPWPAPLNERLQEEGKLSLLRRGSSSWRGLTGTGQPPASTHHPPPGDESRRQKR